ncbi:hypothetical protein CspHIS471_0208580 [Cutaneotrichosporon sp. HIS471]|nr:hypothetical protein CspHIS471_0208580 [Cutaneotrichosporon sp. HIS471]
MTIAHLVTEIALHVGGDAIANKMTVTSDTPTGVNVALVLPQEGWHPDSPFVRAYAPLLAHRNISPEAFARSLDGVNEALITSPSARLHNLLGLPPPSAEALRLEEEGFNSDDNLEKENKKYREKKGKHKKRKLSKQLPRGLDRLKPYSTRIIPVIPLPHVNYTYKGSSDGMANWGAKGQAKKTAENERRGCKALARGKTKVVNKLLGKSIWFVVV